MTEMRANLLRYMTLLQAFNEAGAQAIDDMRASGKKLTSGISEDDLDFIRKVSENIPDGFENGPIEELSDVALASILLISDRTTKAHIAIAGFEKVAAQYPAVLKTPEDACEFRRIGATSFAALSAVKPA